jgi:hypothetical protein
MLLPEIRWVAPTLALEADIVNVARALMSKIGLMRKHRERLKIQQYLPMR